MKKIIFFALLTILTFALSSCSGCVKKASKEVTGLVGDAISGINEAISEDEGKLAEETTDAVGTVAEGAGRSVDRQLGENTTKVAGTTGRTLVQSVVGTIDGIKDEVEKIDQKDYEILNFKAELPSGLSIDLVGRKKYSQKVELFFKMDAGSAYDISIDFYDKDGNIIIYKDFTVKKESNDRRTITDYAFSLTGRDSDYYKKVEKVLIKGAKSKAGE